jgi:amidase
MSQLQSRRFQWMSVCRILFLSCVLFIGSVCTGAAASVQKKDIQYSRQDLVFLPAYQLATLIRTGEVSSSEVVDAFLEQISLHNEKLNAIVTMDEQGARKRAQQADDALAGGELWGPLHGVPITIKDNYATAGMKTTTSYPPLADHVPDFDATIVTRLKDAGAIIIGKTNLPQLGMDCQTNSPIFGVTNNPWDQKRTPGGSTGGGAAAVAAGMSALSMGNDIGGSIRIPSHFCGIYGIKPTENLVSKFGINPGFPRGDYRSVRHLVSCGPLARSIEDLKLSLRVIAGPDNKDEDVPYISLAEPKKRDLKTLRIAWMDDFGGVPVTKETSLALKQFTEKLAERGCTVKHTGPEDFNPDEIWSTYGKIMDMEVGVATPSFMRFISYLLGASYRKDVPFLEMVYPITYDKYMKALTIRDSQVSNLEHFFDEWDVWLCPVTCTPAYWHIKPKRYFGPYPLYDRAVLVDNKPVNYLVANLSYTTIFNLTGSPVVVIPIGYTKEGIPIGVQVVGKRWHDMDLLGFAQQLDEVAAAFRNPPGY